MAPWLVAGDGASRQLLQQVEGRQQSLDRDSASTVTHWKRATIPQVHQAINAPNGASSALYAGVGAGVGSLLLIAILYVSLRIYRQRRDHRRAMVALEQREAIATGQINTDEIMEIPRPVSMPWRPSLRPYLGGAGWGALGSNEEVAAQGDGTFTRAGRRLNAALFIRDPEPKASLPKRIRQRGIPLRQMKKTAHLSAIIESPRSRGKSPSSAMQQLERVPEPQNVISDSAVRRKTISCVLPEETDIFVCPGSPKASAVPSFAILPKQLVIRDGAASAPQTLHNGLKPVRSRSMGTYLGPIPDDAMFGDTSRLGRPPMHSRSFSLGSHLLSMPPTAPVPPLPNNAASGALAARPSHQAEHSPSRVSVSSQASTHSSVLMVSPLLHPGDHAQQSAPSPSLEQVAATDNGDVKEGAFRHWSASMISGPRPMGVNRKSDLEAYRRSQASIRSAMARYSTDSALSADRISRGSTVSSLGVERNSSGDRLSVPQIKTVDRVSISRVSSIGSAKSSSPTPVVQVLTTPRRAQRNTVSVYGSPVERRRTSVMSEVSGNSIKPPARQTSNSTQNSSRSSNGNPFQWDGPMQKPSALKGSPSARKGHRRQNCVRISTLAPQILGPPSSRPTSPVMQGIQEESPEHEDDQNVEVVNFSRKAGLHRPPSSSNFAPSLRLKPANLRASLTPSSPTLSTFRYYYQEQESAASRNASEPSLPVSRPRSGLSNNSSLLSIPKFPSPSKPSVPTVTHDHEWPTPVFCLSRPSTELNEDDENLSPVALHASSDDENLSPFALHASSDDENLSPFALHASSDDEPQDITVPAPANHATLGADLEYDPARPFLALPHPQTGSNEYDPASPMLDLPTPDKSSPTFPFASATRDSPEHVSPLSRPSSYVQELPDTPPCSPKSIPDGFRAFFAGAEPQARTEKEPLTSGNASSMLAELPQTTSALFASAPSFPPPQDPPHPFPSADLPSPLHLHQKNTSPSGPRTEPAKPVLKTAQALRRMNSEINHDHPFDRESRRYTRLGREPSPLLPFIGTPDPDLSDSCNELFDFDFAACACAPLDAEAGADRTALDNVDIADLERRLGLGLAGFATPSSSEGEGTPKGGPAELCLRESSVWDDGEKFWETSSQTPQWDLDSSHVGVDITPKRKDWAVDANVVVTATPRLKLHGPNGSFRGTPSVQETPRSLYDADGFLKT